MISVIIPTLNAEHTIVPILETVRAPSFISEVIVSDGGSSDATCKLAEKLGASVISGEANRGGQLAAGAKSAKNDWLLFIHADSVLDPHIFSETESYISQSAAQKSAAYFKFNFQGSGFLHGIWHFGVSLRCRLWGLPYGDQGLLIHRELYEEVGGFRPIPLMEDVDLVKRIGKSRLHALSATLSTSPDKFRRNGYFKQSWQNLRMLRAYLNGASADDLYARYYGNSE